MSFEILHHPAAEQTTRPPLLFVHGSFCGAWVWEQHFLPWFAAQGWQAHAVSLRGHGRSGGAVDLYGLDDYVADIAQAVAQIGDNPIIIGHSLGGMVAQKYATHHDVRGMVLMSSVPPSGLGTSAWHMMTSHPHLLWQLGMLQSLGPQAVEPLTIYRCLFSTETPISTVMQYMPNLQMESRRATLELMMPNLPPVDEATAPPCLVLGGDQDAFIPVSALEETARFHHADLEIIHGLPHGVMLDATWEMAARAIALWLDRRGFA